MPNPFTCLGFDVANDADVERLTDLTSRQGEALAAPSGYYLYYRIDAAIELWGHADPTAHLIDCVPHFRGESRIRLGVGDLVRRRDQPLDGRIYGWANPTAGRPDTGDYPLAIRIPDFELLRARVSPGTVVVLQITAFAAEFQLYADDQTFAAAQSDRMRLAPEAFVPTGMFADQGDTSAGPSTQAIFSGHVRRARLLQNGLTGNSYYHFLVATFGGAYDVVVDPSLVSERPEEGSVVRGAFRLSGRLAA